MEECMGRGRDESVCRHHGIGSDNGADRPRRAVFASRQPGQQRALLEHDGNGSARPGRPPGEYDRHVEQRNDHRSRPGRRYVGARHGRGHDEQYAYGLRCRGHAGRVQAHGRRAGEHDRAHAPRRACRGQEIPPDVLRIPRRLRPQPDRHDHRRQLCRQQNLRHRWRELGHLPERHSRRRRGH